MFRIVDKVILNPLITQMEVNAPAIANKAKPGQFIILRIDEFGERIPLTIAGIDKKLGNIKIVFQIVGRTTKKLNTLNINDCILDVVGPLGEPSKIQGLKTVCLVGGGVGTAICLPLAKAMFADGVDVEVILGFRNKDLIIFSDEFKKYSNRLEIVTDDGSNGNKGLVTDALNQVLKTKKFDQVFAIGPLAMMKYVTLLTKKYNQKTTVSMNPVMIDGTGMCGGCRLTIAGEQKFACIDGPEFDAFTIDFDEAIARSKIYRDSREEDCNLLR